MGRVQPAVGAVTGPELVVISERAYYKRCYRLAVDATISMGAVGVLLAFVDGNSAPEATVGLSLLVAAVGVMLRGERGYRWLRANPRKLALVGPLAALSAFWPTVDQNALYFPALGPLAIIACVASHRHEALQVIASLAGGTCAAALLDSRAPELSGGVALSTATFGAIVSGTLLTIVADWCAMWVLGETLAKLDPPYPGRDRLVKLVSGSEVTMPHAASLIPPARPPLPATALSESAAREKALWIVAIRDRIISGLARARQTWVELTTFRARELQVLLLRGGGLSPDETAKFLGISTASVQRYATAAVATRTIVLRERFARSVKPDAIAFELHTADDIASELTTRFPTAARIDALAAKAGVVADDQRVLHPSAQTPIAPGSPPRSH